MIQQITHVATFVRKTTDLPFVANQSTSKRVLVRSDKTESRPTDFRYVPLVSVVEKRDCNYLSVIYFNEVVKSAQRFDLWKLDLVASAKQYFIP